MHNYCPRVSNVTPFRSTTSRFWNTGEFETSVPNDPELTMNATRSYVPHICVTSIQESHIPLIFALRPAVFELQAILTKSTEWPQKDPKHYKVKCTPYVLLMSLIPKFHSVSLYGQLF